MDATTQIVAQTPRHGVYFGLDEHVYRADPALGSTDVRKLARNPSTYWWESWMNPNRPADKRTPARVRGTAMHRLVLEGEKAFDSEYMRGPTMAEDMTLAEKGAATKAANKEAAASGLTCLPAEDYDRIVVAGSMITQNPALKNAFTGGMPEVSIFWEKDGVRRKARFDYLKIRGIADLKGCANTRDLAFPQACRNDINNYAYHEQASWYADARTESAKAVANGCVAGDHDSAWLKRVADERQWGWQWVFHQMEGAPITWSAILSPENPIMEVGRAANERGVETYRRYMAERGPDLPWLLIEQPHELLIDDLPVWFGR
jgi:hypothetical protein